MPTYKAVMENATTYLFTQGVLGVAVVGLSYVVGKLYNKTERLEKEKSDIAEARRIDDKTQAERLTLILQENTLSNKILAEKIEVGKSIERESR